MNTNNKSNFTALLFKTFFKILRMFSCYSLDLKTLSLERVEILLRVVPNEKEVKEFKQYERDRKSFEILSDEDKFIYSVRILLIVYKQ